jgi:hypothetical protein
MFVPPVETSSLRIGASERIDPCFRTLRSEDPVLVIVAWTTAFSEVDASSTFRGELRFSMGVAAANAARRARPSEKKATIVNTISGEDCEDCEEQAMLENETWRIQALIYNPLLIGSLFHTVYLVSSVVATTAIEFRTLKVHGWKLLW